MKKPKIMVVGCFHMAGHNDLRGVDAGDVFSDEHQKEIRTIIDNLKGFEPTKIAVEVEKKNSVDLNENYQQYVNNKYNLRNNEVEQIGFRLASELDHNNIYAVDWMEKGAATYGAGDIYEYVKKHQPQLHQKLESYMNDVTKDNSTRFDEIFRFTNSPSIINKTTEMYLNMAQIGIADDYYGMGWLIWWYQRNLIIFANLAELAESNDRIMLLIGGSHTGILNGFLKDSGLFEVVDAVNYL